MKLLSQIGFAVLGAGFLSIAVAPSAQAQTAYAIANGGTSLIRFDLSSPTSVTLIGDFNGATDAIDAIDFRPLNGVLYGYRDENPFDATDNDTLFTIDLNTATVTKVASGVTGATAETTSRTSTNLLDLDFNPTIDRVRVVDANTKNLVYDPNSSAAPSIATPLAYPDPSTQTAQIVGNAYTNNIAGATTTVQYGINAFNSSLVTIANNAGTLTTVGSLGVTINSTPFVGFDIYTPTIGSNFGYAILDTTAGLSPTLYSINLTTGAATSIGSIGNGLTNVYGLAITPTLRASAAPEPGSIALALTGAGALTCRIVIRRRRKTA